MSKFSINNLECIRQNNILFKGLNLSMEDGALLQINGANGSGKSSLLQVCTGLIQVTTGEVLWNNININQHRYEFQNNILYIGHTNAIKATLTVEENMMIIHSLTGSKSKINYSTILKKIGMSGMNKIFPYNMSAGQKRRLGLTRLFMTKSKLWFLDEPFNALDKEGKKIIENLIKQIDHPVRWTEAVGQLAAGGVENIFEVGPGKVLTGLNKRINKTLSYQAINSVNALEAL